MGELIVDYKIQFVNNPIHLVLCFGLVPHANQLRIIPDVLVRQFRASFHSLWSLVIQGFVNTCEKKKHVRRRRAPQAAAADQSIALISIGSLDRFSC